jgi:hypothetical protein
MLSNGSGGISSGFVSARCSKQVYRIIRCKANEYNTHGGILMSDLHTKLGDADRAAADMKMVTHLTEVNIEIFANENNIWRSQQLRIECMHDDDLAMER